VIGHGWDKHACMHVHMRAHAYKPTQLQNGGQALVNGAAVLLVVLQHFLRGAHFVAVW